MKNIQRIIRITKLNSGHRAGVLREQGLTERKAGYKYLLYFIAEYYVIKIYREHKISIFL